MAEILVGEGHNGGAISAKPGDTIVIQLPENPTTGYRWNVAEADARLLQPQSDNFTPGGAGLGAAGLRVLRYLARGQGEGSVTLYLARPWEPNAPRLQFSIRVNVNP